MGKIKGYFVRNWEEILAGIIGTIITAVLGKIFGTLWNFMGELIKMNKIYNLVLWLVFAIGFSVIVYAFLRSLRWIFTKNSDVIRLEKDFDENYLDEITRRNKNYFRLWVIVQNGKRPVYDCVVGLENLEYQGRSSNGEWVHAPTGFDRKAMKWDVGYIPKEGKIDLSAKARKVVEIAAAFPQPLAKMKLSHLDGYSTKEHLLEGKYRATLRIDGKVPVSQSKKDIEPRWYEVEYEYQRHSMYLKLLDVKEYKPEETA